jgi:cobalt/nickel transport system permease protein
VTEQTKGIDSPGATLRILLALAWVFHIALLPNRLWHFQSGSIVLAALLMGRCGLRARLLGSRMLGAIPFIALVAVGQWGRPDAAERVLNLFLKGLLSLWVMSLLTASTPMSRLLGGLQKLGVPLLIVQLLAFWERYVHVLRDEWERMRLAREARTIHVGRRIAFTVLAQSLGLLLVRSYERAERVHQAMLARGYRVPGTTKTP